VRPRPYSRNPAHLTVASRCPRHRLGPAARAAASVPSLTPSWHRLPAARGTAHAWLALPSRQPHRCLNPIARAWPVMHHLTGGSFGRSCLLWSPPPPSPASDAMLSHHRSPPCSASIGPHLVGPNVAGCHPTWPPPPAARCRWPLLGPSSDSPGLRSIGLGLP
jgi:hypothetical protein